MLLRQLTKADFDAIHQQLTTWWRPEIRALFHPMFLYQFGSTAFVAEIDHHIAGFVAGFRSQTNPADAYIHLVCTNPQLRRQGVARALYEFFFQTSAQLGCRRVVAITGIDNHQSVAFHTSLGFRTIGVDSEIPPVENYVPNYSGPGEHRILMGKTLRNPTTPTQELP